MTDTELCRVDQLSEEGGHIVHVGGAEVAVFMTEAGVFAIANRCPHGEGSLAEGWREGLTIECPLHAAVFNLTTGEPISGPVFDALKTYRVHIEGEGVFLSR